MSLKNRGLIQRLKLMLFTLYQNLLTKIWKCYIIILLSRKTKSIQDFVQMKQPKIIQSAFKSVA